MPAGRADRPRFRVASAALALTAIALAACGSSGGRTNGPVAVYPVAGTEDISPASEISFRGRAAGDLGTIRVVGSRTGAHRGRLVGHRDGKGASFVPASPFAAGEIVRVHAGVHLVGARGRFVTVRVEQRPGRLGKNPTFPDGSQPIVPGTSRFRSRPDLHPARVRVTTASRDRSAGYVFLAPKGGPGQNGPLILDDLGNLVWFHPLPRRYKSYDFRVQRYRGQRVLTWWQGKAAGAWGGGTGVIVDRSYRTIATVRGANGYQPDIHEFTLTPRGTALVLAYKAVRADLRSMGGTLGASALDCVVQEIDVASRRVLFEWHALGHIPFRESFAKPIPGHTYDWVHVNSVSLDRDGNFLVSARNTSTVYKVDRRTGRIIWRLGGKRSTFRLPKRLRFVGQHDARRWKDGTLSLFDNGSVKPPPQRPSRALVFSLDEKARVARLVHAFTEPTKRGTFSQGSMQRLPNGNYVVGWGGGNPKVSEFSPRGRLLFDAHLLPKVESYRAYRARWTGRPVRKPAVAALRGRGATIVYASWNGSTQVRSWRVLGGARRDALRSVAGSSKHSFETRIRVTLPLAYVAVRALDGSGRALATSRTIRVR